MLKSINGSRAAREHELVEALFSGEGGSARAAALLKDLEPKGQLRLVPVTSITESTTEKHPPPERADDQGGQET